MTKPAGVDVVALTTDYERWLATKIPLISADLAAKHTQMTESLARFVRGTYYLWLTRMVALMPEMLETPTVPAVGDLHVENFGTWQDRDRVRRWGVNDLDELARAGYPLDLIRLATSAVLSPDITTPPHRICHLIAHHWQEAPAGRAVEIDRPDARHLAALLPATEADATYFTALAAGLHVEPDQVPEPVRKAVLASAPSGWVPTWHRRRSGTGSLGHPRLVAVGRGGDGAWHAREVKLLGPGTADWVHRQVAPAPGAHLPRIDNRLYAQVVADRCGPAGERVDGWQIRRLAPDTVRIKLAARPQSQADRVIGSMAEAVAAIHAVDPAALQKARAHCAARGGHWLLPATEVMAADIRACHGQWRRNAGLPHDG